MRNKFLYNFLFLFLLQLPIAITNISAEVIPNNKLVTSNNPANYDSLLKSANERISALKARVASRPNEWLIRERLIATTFEKALLTNNVNDYQTVEQELNATIALAPKGSGPLMLAVKFNYSIHRLSKAEEYIEQMKNRAALKSTDALTMLALSSDIAFHKGEYAKALEGYRLCELAAPGVCTKQLITYYTKTGGYTESEALLKNNLIETAKTDFQTLAWLNLQLGILSMERGEYKKALEYLSEADKKLPNWWLVREHMAEVHTLMKNDKDAQPIYEDIVSKTNLPQYMDALAGVYKRQGKEKEADELIKKAETLWEEQLKIFPESASGHALDHYLKYSTDNKKILTLAENNFKTRPNSEAKLYLAKAYLRNNQLKLAQEQIDSALNSPYKSTDLFDTAREIYSELGDKVKSESFKVLCIRINHDFYNN